MTVTSSIEPTAEGTPATTATPRIVLEATNVVKRFGGVVAVKNANIKLHQGQVTSLIGPNGAGKTTLFNAITGCIPATEGRILFHSAKGSHRIEDKRPDQITRLGIARTFQNIRLFANLSVLENVCVGFHIRTKSSLLATLLNTPATKRSEQRVRASAMKYLQFCNLEDVAHERAGSLPYGDQRRLEIARALASGPSLLLLDEPAAGMNPSESVALLQLVRNIVASGITVLLIEHDMKVVMSISQHIYVLDHSEIIAEGLPADIVSNPQVIEAYLGAGAHTK